MSTSQRWSPDLGGREVANGRNSLVLTEEPLRRWRRMCAWEIDGDGLDGFPTEVLQLGSVVLLQCVKLQGPALPPSGTVHQNLCLRGERIQPLLHAG